MSSRDTRLAESALAAQYEMAGIDAGNPWHGVVAMKIANIPPSERDLYINSIRSNAAAASTIVVDTEFTELIQHAAQDLLFQWQEGDETPEALLPYDVPNDHGFVWFAHHVLLDATDDYQMGCRGILWWTTSVGVSFIPFAGRGFWKEISGFDEMSKTYGRAPEVIPHDLAGWHFGKQWRLDPTAPVGWAKTQDEDGVGLFNPSAAADRAIVWAFFRLVSQRIPRVKKVMPGRPTMRLLARKPLLHFHPQEDGGIRVYTLRKEIEDTTDHATNGTDEAPSWTHRWTVEPHWARRRVAVRDDDGTIVGNVHGEEGTDWIYRRVYIARHIKGPENLPLVLKDSVGVLKR